MPGGLFADGAGQLVELTVPPVAVADRCDRPLDELLVLGDPVAQLEALLPGDPPDRELMHS